MSSAPCSSDIVRIKPAMLENKSCIGTSFSTLKGIDFCALCVSEHALLYDMDRFVRVYFSREAD